MTDLTDEKLETLWIEKHVKRNNEPVDSLDDYQYIKYHKWDQDNSERLYKKYKPNDLVFIGKHSHIIFHGGCLGCKIQELYDVEMCRGCMFFRFDRKKPSLRVTRT